MLFFSSQNERGAQTRPGLESTQRLGHPKLNMCEMVVLIDVTVLCWLWRLNLCRGAGVRLANFGVYRNGVMLLHRWLLLLPVALRARDRDRLGDILECTRFRIVGQRENDRQKEEFLDHYIMWIF